MFSITQVGSINFSSFSLILLKKHFKNKILFFPFQLERKHWVNFSLLRERPQRPFKTKPMDLFLVLGNKWRRYRLDFSSLSPLHCMTLCCTQLYNCTRQLCVMVIWVQSIICPHAELTNFTYLLFPQISRNHSYPYPCSDRKSVV